jgi:hypothetical protein
MHVSYLARGVKLRAVLVKQSTMVGHRRRASPTRLPTIRRQHKADDISFYSCRALSVNEPGTECQGADVVQTPNSVQRPASLTIAPH